MSWSLIISSAGLVISLVTLCFTLSSTKETITLTRQSALRDSMQIYLGAFKQDHALLDRSAKEEDYVLLSPDEKGRVQIVAGLLVGVIDQMNINGDRRACNWVGYLGYLKGPLNAKDFHLLDYAASDKTVKMIEDLRIGKSCTKA